MKCIEVEKVVHVHLRDLLKDQGGPKECGVWSPRLNLHHHHRKPAKSASQRSISSPWGGAPTGCATAMAGWPTRTAGADGT